MTNPAGLTDALEQGCLNCGAPLVGPYCSACGQKDPKPDVTLREFVHDTTHELTELDGKVPRTLKALLRHPGLLTLDYFAGRRARWLTPLRLYLLCSLVFFLSGPAVEAITHRAAREAKSITIKNADGTTVLTPQIREEIAKGLPGRIFGVDRMERAAAHSEELSKAIQSAYPKAMFFLLPLFAFLTRVAWRSNGRRYPSHVNLALHLHAAWFLGLSAVTIIAAVAESSAIQDLVAFAGFAWVLAYSLLTLRTVFGESWPRTIAKLAAVAVVYLPSWFAASLVILGLAMATM